MNFIFKGEVVDVDFYNNLKETTIVFLHGWGGNKFSFSKTIDLLKHKFNILTLTIPTTNQMNLSWNMFDYASLVENMIISFNIKKIYTVCHSFGFRIATILNQKKLISRIVVTGGAGPKKENFFNKIDKNNAKILSKKKFFLKNKKIFMSSDYFRLPKQNKQTFKNIVNFNTISMLKFSCPMEIFWGKKDTETKLWIAKKLSKINNAKLVISKYSHFAYLDDGDKFNHLVLEFFR